MNGSVTCWVQPSVARHGQPELELADALQRRPLVVGQAEAVVDQQPFAVDGICLHESVEVRRLRDEEMPAPVRIGGGDRDGGRQRVVGILDVRKDVDEVRHVVAVVAAEGVAFDLDQARLGRLGSRAGNHELVRKPAEVRLLLATSAADHQLVPGGDPPVEHGDLLGSQQLREVADAARDHGFLTGQRRGVEHPGADGRELVPRHRRRAVGGIPRVRRILIEHEHVVQAGPAHPRCAVARLDAGAHEDDRTAAGGGSGDDRALIVDPGAVGVGVRVLVSVIDRVPCAALVPADIRRSQVAIGAFRCGEPGADADELYAVVVRVRPRHLEAAVLLGPRLFNVGADRIDRRGRRSDRPGCAEPVVERHIRGHANPACFDVRGQRLAGGALLAGHRPDVVEARVRSGRRRRDGDAGSRRAAVRRIGEGRGESGDRRDAGELEDERVRRLRASPEARRTGWSRSCRGCRRSRRRSWPASSCAGSCRWRRRAGSDSASASASKPASGRSAAAPWLPLRRWERSSVAGAPAAAASGAGRYGNLGRRARRRLGLLVAGAAGECEREREGRQRRSSSARTAPYRYKQFVASYLGRALAACRLR